jgi:hypothetical protein
VESSAITHDRSSWAVAGGLMLGLGVGFFFLPESVFGFVGCILGGIGVGLIAAAAIYSLRR